MRLDGMLLNEMNERTCIVTRQAGGADDLIRFVAGPGGAVVPDLKRKLPGRGCWVTADRAHVDRAAKRNLFARALKAGIVAPQDLGATVDALIAKDALGALGLARKAGVVVLGAAKGEMAVTRGEAVLVLHACEASPDGVRKIAALRRARARAGQPDIPAYKLFTEAELGLALGGTNVIHAAVLEGGAGMAARKRVMALGRFRGIGPDDVLVDAEVAGRYGAAEDTE
jgi:predicted RNA-binding protein YlxR (DUF448 family)